MSGESAPLLPHLVIAAFDRLMSDLHRHLTENGYEDLRPTHCLNVFRFMDCGGTRPTTLARRAGMTPQAMGELVGYLERRDYVKRVPDPADGRGRVVVYSDRGEQAAEVAMTFLADLDSHWSDTVGTARLLEVKSALTGLFDTPPSGTPRAATLLPAERPPFTRMTTSGPAPPGGPNGTSPNGHTIRTGAVSQAVDTLPCSRYVVGFEFHGEGEPSSLFAGDAPSPRRPGLV